MIPRLAAILLLLSAPATLRYRYVPGKALRYHVIETTETITQAGERKNTSVQQTTMTIVSRVVASSGGRATVEESREAGQVSTQSPEGKSERILQPLTHVFTLTSRGECLKSERRVPPGVRDPGPSFLDGLSFALPDNPVSPGSTWTGTTSTRGLDGKPIQIKSKSRYVGDVTRTGHPCARIETTFTSAFPLADSAGKPAYQGELTGAITSYFARDLLRDAEIDADINLTLNPTVAPGASAAPTTTIHSRSRQTLTK